MFDHIEDIEDRADREAAAFREIRRRRRAALAATPTIERTEKLCPTCHEVKPANAFGRNAARPDGLQSMCRPCRR